MAKKEIKIHQKGVSTRPYQAARMEGAMRNVGNRQVRKASKSSK